MYRTNPTLLIKSFKGAATQKIYYRERSCKLPAEVQQVEFHKLTMIDNAINLDDLRVPPANCLEKLAGYRHGQYSIRINGGAAVHYVMK